MGSAEEGQASVEGSDPYRGYLLRLWKETPDASWQGYLKCITTGQHYRFSSLADLVAFLGDEEVEPPGGGGTAPGPAVGERALPSHLQERGPGRSYESLCRAPLAAVFHQAVAYRQLASVSILEAASLQGGEALIGAVRRLLSVAAPAVLYASHPAVTYPQSYDQLVARVNAALASGDRALMLALADELEADEPAPR